MIWCWALPAATYVFWNQGYFDAYLPYPNLVGSSQRRARFPSGPGLRDRLKIDLRYTTGEGAVRAHEFATGAGVVPLDPHWHQAGWSFVKAGFAHILAGPDHLLFLVCLVLPLRKLNVYLLGVVTSFTVARSITLIAAAYGLTPAGTGFRPLIETLIAGSVLYMALEIIVRRDVARRWLWSGLFGLAHGFGFSFLLSSQLRFAGSHLLLSLLAFNIGIEAGQLLVLLVVFPVISWILASGWVAERTFILLVSVLVAHTAWHWSVDRAQELAAADWTAAELLPLFLAAGFLAILGAALAAFRVSARLQRRRAAGLQEH